MSAESDLIFTNPDSLFFHELSNGTELLSRGGSSSAVADFDAEILQTAAGIAPYNGISIPALSGMLLDSIQGADLMASLGDDDQLLGPLSPPPEIMNEGGFSQTSSTGPLVSAVDEDIKPGTGVSANPTGSASVASSAGVGDISVESPLSPFIKAKMGVGSPHSAENGAERMRTGFGIGGGGGGEGRGDLRAQRRIVQMDSPAVNVRGHPLYVSHSFATSPGSGGARAETALVSSLQDVYMSRAADGGIECLLSPTTSGRGTRGGATAGSAGRPPSFVVGGMSHGAGGAGGSSPASSPPGRAAITASERLSDLSLEQQQLHQLQQQQQRAGGGGGGGGGAYARLGALGISCGVTESRSAGRAGGGGGGSVGGPIVFETSKLRMPRGPTGMLQKSASFAGLSNGTTTTLRRIGSAAPVDLQAIVSPGSVSVDSAERLRPGESSSASLQHQQHNGGGGGGLSSFFGANGCCGAAYDLATSMGRTPATFARVTATAAVTIASVTGVKQEEVGQQGGGEGGRVVEGEGEECDIMVEGEGNDAGGAAGGGLTRAGSFSTSVTPPSPSAMAAAAAAAGGATGSSSPTTCSAAPAHSLGSVSCAPMEEMKERLDDGGFVSSSSGSGALDSKSSALSGAQRSPADKSPGRLVVMQQPGGSFAARGNPTNHVRGDESSLLSSAGTSGGIDSGGDCLRPLRLTQRAGGGGGMSAMQRSHSSHALGQLRTLAPAPSIPESTLPSFSRLMPLEQTSSRLGPSGGNLQPKLSDLQNLTSRPIMPAFGMRRVHSAGDIQTLNGMHVAMGGLHSLGDRGALEDGFRIGRYTMEERKKRINRYRQKRSERNFNKKIKYACRKTLADSRPRVRGRFARNDEVEVGAKAAPAKGQEDEHHEDEEGDEDDESPDMLVDEELDDDILLGPESEFTDLLNLPTFKFDCGRTTSV
ncbi:hypothetical protein CBR_g66814 [Chara braunii]|uniref:CCT domain-containing protein n=1 Tax=Chara braunii TaxID=69332 RepID=A0A388K9H8_CHABU|nr:hypothetical protein CBR_g66814 [Chara braunii]|eukprot:GBG66679.1 hypothetical protein CBR_g66814 [Chara braunii]